MNLSDDKDYIPIGQDDPSLTGAQLTSSIADVKAFVQRRNVITPLSRNPSSRHLILFFPGLPWRREWQRGLGRAVMVLWQELLRRPKVTTFNPLGSTIWKRGWIR